MLVFSLVEDPCRGYACLCLVAMLQPNKDKHNLDATIASRCMVIFCLDESWQLGAWLHFIGWNFSSNDIYG